VRITLTTRTLLRSDWKLRLNPPMFTYQFELSWRQKSIKDATRSHTEEVPWGVPH